MLKQGKNKISNFYSAIRQNKNIEKAEIGLVKMIAQENMPIQHTEKTVNFMIEFIPDPKIV